MGFKHSPMVARKGWEAKCDNVTMWLPDSVTDTTGSWDAHACKKGWVKKSEALNVFESEKIRVPKKFCSTKHW